MKITSEKSAPSTTRAGSAIVLSVLLTTMLAIIGVMFVMSARMDKNATSAVSENKQLNYAVETIIAEISDRLILDTPGIAEQEYYDYPDSENLWLASLEPYKDSDSNDYKWRQISDVTGYLNDKGYDTSDVDVEPTGLKTHKYVDDYTELRLNSDNEFLNKNGNKLSKGVSADADGDGIADSKWFVLDNITSGKGKPILAAVRIIDNSAMLNVNTAYKFDPNESDPNIEEKIDGSSQMHINLAELSQRAESNGSISKAADTLQAIRCGDEPATDSLEDIEDYEENVLWRYSEAAGKDYTPFDIADELELRNRFILDNEDIKTRLEDGENFWKKAFLSNKVPCSASASTLNLDEWVKMVCWDISDSNAVDSYCFRHIATTFNFDRIINPDMQRMFSLNIDTDELDTLQDSEEKATILYRILMKSISKDLKTDNFEKFDDEQKKRIPEMMAQLAVNIVDFCDEDDKVTQLDPWDGLFEDDEKFDYWFDTDEDIDSNSDIDVANFDEDDVETVYGFDAQPFISEIALKIDRFPSINQNFFAVELYNPFSKDIELNPDNVDDDWEYQLVLYDADDGNDYIDITDPNKTIYFDQDDLIKAESCFVIANQLSEFDIHVDSEYMMEEPNLTFFGSWTDADKDKPPVDIRPDPDKSEPPVYIGWSKNSILLLKRRVKDSDDENKKWIFLDKQIVHRGWAPAASHRYYQRSPQDWHIVYQTMEEGTKSRPRRGQLGKQRSNLGRKNNIDLDEFEDNEHNFSFFLTNPIEPKAELVTVGDIPQILTIGNGEEPNGTIGEILESTRRIDEMDIRLDLQNPYHRNIFQYLTVIDPAKHNKSILETRVKGRLNINTAPWYVIARLPWMTGEIAQAIIAYRDKIDIEDLGSSASINYSGTGGRYDAIKDECLTDTFDGLDANDIRETAGFESIGELNLCIAEDNADYTIQKYAVDGDDLEHYPDLTRDGRGRGDRNEDDFEERDVIFSRISNLVTVRSDVFTAYILIRIGTNGPQKRVVVILDRSGVNSGRDNVTIYALQPAIEPR